MCDLCKTNQIRNYSHAKTGAHKKKLFKIMCERKKNNWVYYFPRK